LTREMNQFTQALLKIKLPKVLEHLLDNLDGRILLEKGIEVLIASKIEKILEENLVFSEKKKVRKMFKTNYNE